MGELPGAMREMFQRAIRHAGDALAQRSCEASIDAVPDLHVRSGRMTLASAYRFSPSELAAYTERLEAGPAVLIPAVNEDVGSQFICIVDGQMQTTGTVRVDTGRVAILIDGREARLWAIAQGDGRAIPLDYVR